MVNSLAPLSHQGTHDRQAARLKAPPPPPPHRQHSEPPVKPAQESRGERTAESPSSAPSFSVWWRGGGLSLVARSRKAKKKREKRKRKEGCTPPPPPACLLRSLSFTRVHLISPSSSLLVVSLWPAPSRSGLCSPGIEGSSRSERLALPAFCCCCFFPLLLFLLLYLSTLLISGFHHASFHGAKDWDRTDGPRDGQPGVRREYSALWRSLL